MSKPRHSLRIQRLEDRFAMDGCGVPAGPLPADSAGEAEEVATWQNHELATDVNEDGKITAMDALTVINEMHERGPGELDDSVPPRACVDVNGDGSVTAADALRVINELASPGDDTAIALANQLLVRYDWELEAITRRNRTDYRLLYVTPYEEYIALGPRVVAVDLATGTATFTPRF